MIPLKDNIPTSRLPVITLILIGINVIIYFFFNLLDFGGNAFIAKYALIPANVISGGRFAETGLPLAAASFVTSQFIHGDFLHIAGNMLFLWIFGNNIEDKMGSARFVIFYLLCGVLAGMAQILPDPGSMIPMIGASGAIAGVMGAYLLEYPRARVLTLIWIIFIVRIVWLPAFVIIIYWIALQVLYQVSSGGEAGGVAYMAHIGGFAAGLLLVKPFGLLLRRQVQSR